MAKGKRKIWVTDEQYALLYPSTNEGVVDESKKEDEEMAKKKMPLWAKILIGVGASALVGGGTYAAVSYLGKEDDDFDDDLNDAFEDDDDPEVGGGAADESDVDKTEA